MPLSFIRKASGPHLSVPDVRTKSEASLLTHLYLKHPRLGETAEPWNARLVPRIGYD